MRKEHVFLTCLLMVCLSLTSCGREAPKEEQKPKRAVKVFTVKEPLKEWVMRYPGRSIASTQVGLSFRVSGPLVDYPVNVGDAIEKGQLLAKIDPRDFNVQIAEIQGKIKNREASVKRAERDLSRLKKATEEDPGAVAQLTIDKATQERDSEKGLLLRLQAELENAKNQLKDTELRSPFNGKVVAKNFENFEYINAQQSIIRILDTDKVEMVIYLPEETIPFIDNIVDIKVRYVPFPDTVYKGKVFEVGTEATPGTRTYPINIQMKQIEGQDVLAGMSGEAEITFKIPERLLVDGVTVPAEAVGIDNVGQHFVWIIDKRTNKARKQVVDVVTLSKDGLVLRGNLDVGNTIATSGVNTIQEGMEVLIVGKSEE